MTAFEVRKLPKVRRASTYETCANRCRAGNPAADTGYRPATHEVLICGYPTLVCTPCATAWRRIWAGAISTDDELQEAA